VRKLKASGRFTKSLYLLLEKVVFGSNNKWIWKAKLPVEINFFSLAALLECYSRQK
jgi:hypothetical protein